MILPSNRNYVLRANSGLQSSSTPVRFPVTVILVGVELLRLLVARMFHDGMLNQGLAAAGGEETTSDTTEEGRAQMYPDMIVKCLVAT